MSKKPAHSGRRFLRSTHFCVLYCIAYVVTCGLWNLVVFNQILWLFISLSGFESASACCYLVQPCIHRAGNCGWGFSRVALHMRVFHLPLFFSLHARNSNRCMTCAAIPCGNVQPLEQLHGELATVIIVMILTQELNLS